MNTPEQRWAALLAKHPDPKCVVDIRALLTEIAAIDNDTPWQEAEPRWWLDMMVYQTALATVALSRKTSEPITIEHVQAQLEIANAAKDEFERLAKLYCQQNAQFKAGDVVVWSHNGRRHKVLSMAPGYEKFRHNEFTPLISYLLHPKADENSKAKGMPFRVKERDISAAPAKKDKKA